MQRVVHCWKFVIWQEEWNLEFIICVRKVSVLNPDLELN